MLTTRVQAIQGTKMQQINTKCKKEGLEKQEKKLLPPPPFGAAIVLAGNEDTIVQHRRAANNKNAEGHPRLPAMLLPDKSIN